MTSLDVVNRAVTNFERQNEWRNKLVESLRKEPKEGFNLRAIETTAIESSIIFELVYEALERRRGWPGSMP